MSKTLTFATKLSPAIIHRLDGVCDKLGLRKNYVVEAALVEKLEDLVDAYDLQEAMRDATGFHPWGKVRAERRVKQR